MGTVRKKRHEFNLNFLTQEERGKVPSELERTLSRKMKNKGEK